MKISGIQADVVRVPFDADYWGRSAWKKDYVAQLPNRSAGIDTSYPLRWRMRHKWGEDISTIILRVTTDDGVVGFGESKGPIAPHAVKAYIDDYLADWLIGEDPFNVRVIWDRLRASMRGRGHIQGLHQEASAGLDIACWDIIGKAVGRPVSELLGGRYRNEIPVYYSGIAGVRDPNDAADRERLFRDASGIVPSGHRSVKIACGFGHKADLASVDIVRQALGDDTLILIDVLGAYDYTQALSLANSLAQRGVTWFETPLPTDDFGGYVELSKRSPILIATDLVWTMALTREMLSAGGRMVFIPESIKVGISECYDIARLADQFGCGFAPHCSVGSALQIAANSHVSAAAPNFVISEVWHNRNPLIDSLFDGLPTIEDGTIRVSDSPGLGLTLNEDVFNTLVDDVTAHPQRP